MNPTESYIIKEKIILSISAIFLILAISLFGTQNLNYNKSDYTLAYETYNTKEMGKVEVAIKKNKADNIFSTTISNKETATSKFKAVTLVNKNATSSDTTPAEQISTINKQIWYLPTEQGYITQYAHYGHIALDITSSRGTNERIYPVATGTITSIYHDSAGAKIVTVNHYINGQYYTSQYVHMSWFAPDIYVGKKVTVNDCLGGMGATGIATGIHLHITVLDCNLYDPNDPNCSTLNSFYNYGRRRVSQGFTGLNSLMNVPYSWYSR